MNCVRIHGSDSPEQDADSQHEEGDEGVEEGPGDVADGSGTTTTKSESEGHICGWG